MLIAAALLANPAFPSTSSVRYRGLEHIARPADPDAEKGQWAYDCAMYIEGDKVAIYKRPLVLEGKRRLYSASIGGFPSFLGRIERLGGKIVVRFKMVSCEYCGHRDDTPRLVEMIALKNGDVSVDRVVYKKAPVTTEQEAIELAGQRAWGAGKTMQLFPFRKARPEREGDVVVRWIVSFGHEYPALPKDDFEVRVYVVSGAAELIPSQ